MNASNPFFLENFLLTSTPIAFAPSIPWSGRRWCYFLGNTDRSTITRLGAEAEDDVFFMSSSYRLHAVFICLVPNTGKRIIILGLSMAMHGRQDSTTPDRDIHTRHECQKKKFIISSNVSRAADEITPQKESEISTFSQLSYPIISKRKNPSKTPR